MRAAQALYEEGFITYHRTDSTNLAMEAVGAVRKFIAGNFGEKYTPEKFRFYKTKSKVAQEAHEAIRPTDVNVLSASDAKNLPGRAGIKLFPEKLGREAQLLYSLIWRRFLACQMTGGIIDQTTISVNGIYKNVNKFLLKTSLQKLKFDGWLILYEKGKTDEKNNDNNGIKEGKMPLLSAGEKLNLLDIISLQKFTEPPPRYNEASLIKALEEKGIGRPSTYAPIISTIEARKYVEKTDRRFLPTDLGFAVVDFLVKYFPKIFDVTFTAGMEDSLDEIANGKGKKNDVLNNFYDPFKKRLDEVFKEADRVKIDLGKVDEVCPDCGSPLVIRMSKFGKFIACSTFPDCKFTKNIIEKAGINCPRCKGEIIVKKTRRGKQFYGCSNYPDCTFAAWKKEDIR